MKTIVQALIDSIHFPIPFGFVENVCIARSLDGDDLFDHEIAVSNSFKGALADCLYSLIQTVNFSESDKSIGSLTDAQRKAILVQVNRLYSDIGEEEITFESKPMVYINC